MAGALLVMVGETVGAVMAMVTFWVALGRVALAAWTTKLKLPVAVGVPERTPLLPFRVRPVGGVPLVMLQVIGVVPVAVKLWL